MNKIILVIIGTDQMKKDVKKGTRGCFSNGYGKYFFLANFKPRSSHIR